MNIIASAARQLRKWREPVNISPDMLSDEGKTRLDALAHTAEVRL